jgi:hypothetical protein
MGGAALFAVQAIPAIEKQSHKVYKRKRHPASFKKCVAQKFDSDSSECTKIEDEHACSELSKGASGKVV